MGAALRFAYNTNGFAHHRLDDAIDVLAALGYEGIALTLDWHHLDPREATSAQLARLRRRLSEAGLAVVLETGARFVLDAWRKHEPTLVSPAGRERRLEFLRAAVDAARALDAEAVTLFAGRLQPGVDPATARGWLLDGCRAVGEHAAAAGVALALEPEPGMAIETLAEALALIGEAGAPTLGIALDVGHVRCSEAIGEVEAIETYRDWIRTVHIEDIAGREHRHRMFGEGDLAFEPILAALAAIGFGGLVSVELSRDSHRAPEVAAAALTFLRARTPACAGADP
jgi:sugar phosphate isomerase/epimerase